MEQPRMVRPGDPAVNFSLKDQQNRTFDLLEHQAERVLLSFHPLAWTQPCAAQMVSLEKNWDWFASRNTIAVGISVDAVPSKRAWAESLGIKDTPMLCDFWPHGRVSARYGIFREANGFSERANIIINEGRDVVFAKVYPVHSIPDIGEVLDFLKGMGS